MTLAFKPASEPWELEAVARLNYETFVEEIPQHAPSADRRLLDPFVPRSTVYVAVEGRELVGMVTVNGERPFSLDRKLPDLDRHLPPARRPCEVRLLAVRRARRAGPVFAGLMRCVAAHCRAGSHDLLLISGAASQTRLYRHLGFVPFGPPLGDARAPYQGMYLSWARWSPAARAVAERREIRPVSLLPGPVDTRPQVRRALAARPVSHRAAAFLRDLEVLRGDLCDLVGAPDVQLLAGSGTLANDVVASRLARLGPGVVLTNGEFGDRLVDHARRAGCDFEPLASEWGRPLPLEALSRAGRGGGPPAWLWAVHCETSTGVLHDIDALRAAARRMGARLALDAISSIGTVPLDLTGVSLATATSGKGLAAYPGIALVFHQPDAAATPGGPRALDLAAYAGADGVPYTISSNLVAALAAALRAVEAPGQDRDGGWAARFAAIAALARTLRPRLEAAGLRVLAPESIASPAVLTLVPPDGCEAARLGDWLETRGFLASYRSAYLVRRNLLQVCLMGHATEADLEPLPGLVREFLAGRRDANTARHEPGLP